MGGSWDAKESIPRPNPKTPDDPPTKFKLCPASCNAHPNTISGTLTLTLTLTPPSPSPSLLRVTASSARLPTVLDPSAYPYSYSQLPGAPESQDHRRGGGTSQHHGDRHDTSL